MKIKMVPVLLILLLFTHCAATLLPADDAAMTTSTKDLGNGIFETEMDATSYANWGYYNFELKEQPTVNDAATNALWDLGFQRYSIKLNGGGSGNAGAAVLPVIAGDFAGATQAPDFSAAKVDSIESASGGDCNTAGTVLFAFLDDKKSPNTCWFDYNSSNHKLAAKDIVYFLKTGTPNYYKVKILSYYSSTGTAAIFKFQWGAVLAP